jgi:hypothetical protein
MKKIYLPLLVLTLVLGSCNKYEEGPGFSLRSKKARVAGDWKLEKLIYNGQDEPLDADDKDDVWKFDKDGTFEIQDPGFSTEKGKWSFDDKKENITLTFDGGPFALVVEVVRLASNEFWYKYTDGSDVQEVHLMQ